MREARLSGMIRHNHEERQRVQSTVRIHRQPEAKTVSPMNILDQQNVQPKEKRFEQRVFGCARREPIESKFNYDVKPTFFGLNYERIEQLKGKYLQASSLAPQIRIVGHSSVEKLSWKSPSNNFEEQEAKFDRLFTEESHQDKTHGMLREIPFQSALLTRKQNLNNVSMLEPRSKQRSPIERNFTTEEDDDQPLQYRNEELRQYMYRLKHQHSTLNHLSTPKASSNLESQATLARISQIDGSIDDKMKHLFEKIEQKEERKRQRKLAANKSPELKDLEPHQTKSLFVDMGPLVKAIEQQMLLDIEFRKLRQLIPKGGLEAIAKLTAEKCPELTLDALKVCRTESNPLEQSKQSEQLTTEQHADKLVEAYQLAERNYHEKLQKKFPPGTVREWLKEVNVERAESVSLADILTQLNLHVGGEYRNRDLVRIASRISGSTTNKQLSCESLRQAFSWQPTTNRQ